MRYTLARVSEYADKATFEIEHPCQSWRHPPGS
jgi:hypothetical protein